MTQLEEDLIAMYSRFQEALRQSKKISVMAVSKVDKAIVEGTEAVLYAVIDNLGSIIQDHNISLTGSESQESQKESVPSGTFLSVQPQTSQG